ncbi:MAG: lysylphosphatidylglycerol synthase transmembrane domain-containing protein [Acidobacteria bacterium]|nr:lysylphosphatidylglycerol synthase transmembrane domain-containing protein [Acidobacteriota bacterium]
MRAHLRTVFVVGLALALLVWFLRHANLSSVWGEVQHGRVDLLLLALLATGSTYVLRAFRWQYLLLPLGRPHFAECLKTTVIGFAASTLLPARAGEVIRPYLLAKHEGFSPTATFASIVIERMLDMVAVLFLFATFVVFFSSGLRPTAPAVYSTLKVGGLAAFAATLVGLVVMMVVAGHPDRLERWALKIERILPARLARAVAGFVRAFVEGLAVVRQPGRMAVALVLSFPLWLSIALGIWATSRAFHIEMSYPGAFLMMTILVVGVAVPTPGAVGGFHEAFRIGATAFFATPNDRAVGAAIVLHAMSFVPVTIAGAILMAREGLSLSGASGIAAERAAEEVP